MLATLRGPKTETINGRCPIHWAIGKIMMTAQHIIKNDGEVKNCKADLSVLRNVKQAKIPASNGKK